MMNDPDLYDKFNKVEMRDVEIVFNKYAPDYNRIGGYTLDMGCGDGKVTTKIVWPKIGGRVVGVDVSNNMIEHANRKYKNPEIEFRCIDGAMEKIPREWIGKFDRVVSFFCTQYVVNQRQLYKNINQMLKMYGEIFGLFVYQTGNFNIYTKLAKSVEWGKYLTKMDEYISPLMEIENIEQKFPQFLESYGFSTQICCLEQSSMEYSYEDFINFVESINPFLEDVPKHLKSDFMKAATDPNELKEPNFKISRIGDKIDKITMNLTLIVFRATKIAEIDPTIQHPGVESMK